MGIYSVDNINESESMENTLQDTDAFVEACILEELSHLSDEGKEEFVNSDTAKAMVEAGLLRRSSLVRLTKKDDLSRRTTMAAFQLAKEADDPLWRQLVKVQMKRRELIGKIETKYSSKSVKAARLGQRAYLKKKMPLQFMRPAGIREPSK